MDEICFKVERPLFPYVDIFINGIRLSELVPQSEGKLYDPKAINYQGLHYEDVAPPSRHFFGEPSRTIYKYEGKIQVLGCTCGEPPCMPLLCQIDVSDNTVTWSDFASLTYDGDEDELFLYENLGPFVFERTQYEQALEAIRG